MAALSARRALTLGVLASAFTIPALAAPSLGTQLPEVIPVVPAAQPAAAPPPELVASGSTARGWLARSDAGQVHVTQTADGIRLARGDGRGDWAFALATLRDPTTAFKVGHTYRMRLWVRDETGSAPSIGLLLAGGGYQDRPTDASVYTTGRGTAWRLLSRTFVCTHAGAFDTGLYLALPTDGAFALTVRGASVREVDAPVPPIAGRSPARVIGFAGPAGARPDPAVWRYETGGNGWGNEEIETYTDRTTNAALDGAGHLIITARQEQRTGPDGITRPYTSARLTTQDKLTVPPGSYVEAPILAPTGAGVWPAFWMAGANIGTVGWPACGELDIFEGWGAYPDVAHSAVHLGARTVPHFHRQYGWGDPGGTNHLGRALDAQAHRYGVYFDAHVVRFYIDRRPTMTVWADDALAAGDAWPFNLPQHLLVNVAVPAGPHSTFPKHMTVGPISVWSGGIPPAPS